MKTIGNLMILVALSFFLMNCNKKEKQMMVTTGQVSNILTTTADIAGIVVEPGDGSSQYGHCYGTSANPNLSGKKTELGIPVTGGFTSALTGLEPGTKYYAKAYLSRGISDVVYGEEITFTTSLGQVSTLSTTVLSSITTTEAKSGGEITEDGGTSVTARGVCWGTTQNPTIADNKTSDGSGKGVFTSSLTGLAPKTTYYARAYATNKAGTAYGNEISFSTLPVVVVPVITTIDITNITQSTASGGGNITSDGDGTITARGVCWSTSQNPTITDNKTSDGTGKGVFTSAITSLVGGTKYYVRAYATNSAGTAYGNLVNFSTTANIEAINFNSSLIYGSVADLEGNSYKTIKVSSQTWMAENLKVTKYNDGTAITNTTNSASWAALNAGSYCWYNNDISNKTVYGALYNWFAINSGKICPSGWHIPNDPEWKQLELFLGMNQSTFDLVGWRGTTEGGKLKEKGLTHWQTPNTGAENETGFSALPAGIRWQSDFGGINGNGSWWSATESSSDKAWARGLYWDRSSIARVSDLKWYGYSVRCVKNPVAGSIPTNGLVAYYPLNGNADDLSGNLYNGTINGATLSTDRKGMINSAYSFADGQYITMGNILSSVFETNNYSISLWFNRSVDNLRTIINKWQNCCPNTGNNAFWAGPNSFVSNSKISAQTSIKPINTWTHWVVVMNSGTLKLYIDGNLSLIETEHYSVASNKELILGSPATQYSFNGSIDDVRIYNRSLSEDEIISLFNE